MNYRAFLEAKAQIGTFDGFAPEYLPDYLFDFQQALVDWATRKGKSAIFADCGLGKTPMQLVWAENVTRKTNGRVLVVTPLSVSSQTVHEGEKFGIACRYSRDGSPAGAITVTNYERLHLFSADDYVGVVADESSVLKNFDGRRRASITDFMRKRPYRLLCTATAAPNDYIELGTSAEALGELGFMDMLARFFKNDQNTSDTRRRWANHGGEPPKWRFKRHAEQPFWRWVSSWARAIRRPSDLGFADGPFVLPPLIEQQTVIRNTGETTDGLFTMPATSLFEQRREQRATLAARCEAVASLVRHSGPVVVWCHLNEEGDLLEQLIPDAVQVAGKDSDDRKEALFTAFATGNERVLITKPKIGGFGLNWQHCAHMTVFPSHSFEQYYQSVRRCWRFGQTRPVTVDVITTEGGATVLQNLQRKAAAAEKMFGELIRHMNEAVRLDRSSDYTVTEALPAWLS
jgi:hypothetical protein